MANAYLGKISAIVTANTSDFNSKLNASAKEVRSFAASMQSALSRAETSAATSLRGIYTEAQKVERALTAAAGLRLSFKGIDTSKFKDIAQAADQFRRVASAAEQIYKPLSLAKEATESLSNEVRGEFQPALIAAQRQAELMNTALASGLAVSEKSFARVQRRAEETTQAVRRLTEASQSVGGLSTGRELRFQSPQFARSLQDASSLQQRALAIDPVRGAEIGVGSAIENQRIAAAAAERANARLEATRLRPENDSSRAGRLASAEQNVTLATASFNEANAALQKIVASEEQAVLAAKTLAESTASSDAAAKSLAASFEKLRASANQALTGLPQNVAQARQEFDGLLSQVGRLSAAGRGAATPLTNELISLFEAASNGDENIDAVIAKLKQLKFVIADVGDVNAASIGAFSQNFPGNTQGNATGPQGPALPPGFGGRSDAGLGADIEDPTRRLDLLRGRITSIKSTIDSLPDSIRARLVPDIRLIEDTFKSAAAGPDLARGRILGMADALAIVENALARVARGQQFLASVGATGPAVQTNLDMSALAGYEAQLKLLQRTMVGVSDTARGTLATAMAAVNNAINAAFDGGFTANARREIDGMIRALTSLTAAEAKVSFGRLNQEVARVGDIGRRGFDRWSMALQQAGYAVDDFFSVTGGFDQRLRAVSNNITQLAFILGGTTGLFIGLGAVIIGQGVSALIKWSNNGRTSADRTKALNDALQRQKSIVESLAESFKSLGDEMSRGFFSESGQAARSFSKEISGLVKKQKELRDERLLDADPVVRREKAEQEKLNRQLSASDSYAQRVGIQSQIDASRRREAARARAVLLLPPPDAAEVTDTLRRRAPNPFRDPAPLPGGGDLDSIRTRRAALEAPLQRLEEILAEGPAMVDGGLRFEVAAESYDQLRSLAARLDAAISSVVDGAAASIVESARGPAQIIDRGQALIQNAISAGVQGAVSVGSNLERLGDELKAAFDTLEAAAKESDPAAREALVNAAKEQVDAVRQQIGAAKSEVDAIDAVRGSLARFKDALDRVAQEADQNYQSSRQAADDARREDLGRGTTQTADARRRAEADMEDQRLARNRVDETVARARVRAEEDPATAETERRISEINGMLNSTGVLAPGRREELTAERSRLEREAEDRVNRRVENDPAVRAAREDSTRIEQQRQSADRGDDIRRTPAQRAADELAGQLADIRQSFGREAEQGSGLVDFAAQREAQQRAVNDAVRSSAPAIFGLADQVQNAVLQGPSRAALNATDVSTVEGSRELNRLLRGDDAAKNQDLVELQKQSQSLETLVQLAREQGVPATLDF